MTRCRTVVFVIFFGSYCTLSALGNAADASSHSEHSMHHSSINLTKDAIEKNQDHTVIGNDSDESQALKDKEEFMEFVRESNATEHDSHMHHDHHNMDHSMMSDQGHGASGNDISKTGESRKEDLMVKDGVMADYSEHNHDGHGDHDNDHDDHGNGHGGHGMNMNGSDMHGMKMWFHVGEEETILFKEWKVTTTGGMIGSMIGILLLGMFYEGLKYFREYLFKQYISSMQFSTVAVTGESGRVTQVHKVEKHRMLSIAHAIQTCLHVVQIVISYFLMLIFMTYNVWLCLAVVLGSGVGFFIFGWKKATVVDITEHCH